MPDFSYYMHDEAAAFRFQLTGDLLERTAAELDQARPTASSIFGGRPLIVDLSGIRNVDGAGRELIAKWHALGARFVVRTPEAQGRIQQMTEVPIDCLEGKRASWWQVRRPQLLALVGQPR